MTHDERGRKGGGVPKRKEICSGGVVDMVLCQQEIAQSQPSINCSYISNWGYG